MSVQEAILFAEQVIPGEPVDAGIDPRWQAIIAVGKFIESDPDPVWAFARTWGSHPQEDLRDAIATCLLEHLLERHFDRFFPLVEQAALIDPLFADTVLRCWKFGQAEECDNAARFDALSQLLEHSSEC